MGFAITLAMWRTGGKKGARSKKQHGGSPALHKRRAEKWGNVFLLLRKPCAARGGTPKAMP